MPFNLHIPLPGPISYNRRLGGHRPAGTHGMAWWLLWGWLWMPLKWLVLGTVWFTVLVCRLTLTLCRAGVLYWARKQGTHRA